MRYFERAIVNPAGTFHHGTESKKTAHQEETVVREWGHSKSKCGAINVT